MFPQSHWRFDVSLRTTTPEGEIVNQEMDDASAINVHALLDKANALIDAERGRIEDLAELLAEPKAKLEPKLRRFHKEFLATAKE